MVVPLAWLAMGAIALGVAALAKNALQEGKKGKSKDVDGDVHQHDDSGDPGRSPRKQRGDDRPVHREGGVVVNVGVEPSKLGDSDRHKPSDNNGREHDAVTRPSKAKRVAKNGSASDSKATGRQSAKPKESKSGKAKEGQEDAETLEDAPVDE